MSTKRLYIGVDIGGTSIVAARISDKELIEKNEVPTGSTRPFEEIMESLFSAIKPLLTDEVVGIGIGMPGFMDTESGEILAINNIPALQGHSIKKSVEERFNLPAFQNNDANCFALGEAYFGAGKAFNNMVGVTMGTGLGSGIIINRKIYSGIAGGAGEIGCVPMQSGIGDDYCSNALFVNSYSKNGIDLFNEAKAGNQESVKAFDHLARNLGELLRLSMYILAPEAFVIGGAIAKSWEYLEKPLQEEIDKFPFELVRNKVKLLPAQLDNAGLYGAAALCISQMDQ
ncbi:MAG: ROK family protein [Bacteroidota bacterium]